VKAWLLWLEVLVLEWRFESREQSSLSSSLSQANDAVAMMSFGSAKQAIVSA
jgi:hypothetical protein